jgi:molybdate transport system substrate-binding protein
MAIMLLRLCLLFFLAATPAMAAQPLTVFVAASLTDSMQQIAVAYQKRSGVAVKVAAAASSVHARQIEAGAPADLFVSADLEWMDYLKLRGLIDSSSQRIIASNALVLVAAPGTSPTLKIRKGFPLAQALGASGRLAMADPDTVPAGRYGKAALQSLGVWPALEGRLARTENVRAALAFVARGEAPLGIVYASDARAQPSVQLIGIFPASSHPSIVYPAAIVTSSTHPAARDFLRFLASKQAQAVLRAAGFLPAPK